jgi:hypothetical protein
MIIDQCAKVRKREGDQILEDLGRMDDQHHDQVFGEDILLK